MVEPDGPPPQEAGQRFLALDSLRGIAALVVAAYHVEGNGFLFETALFRSGYRAVDFFFVLSGFVITASYGARLSEGFSTLRFMVLRLGRVYPLHLAVLAAFVALEAAQFVFAPGGTTLREPFAGTRSPDQLLATLFLLQAFPVPQQSMWSAQSWSIAVEVWMYLAMALAWRFTGRFALPLALIAAAAAGWALTFRIDALQAPFSSQILRGVLGFGLGVGCWHVWERTAGTGLSAAAATLAEAAALLSCAAVIAWSDYFEAGFVIADLTFMAAVLIFAGQRGAVSRLLCLPPFLLLGTLSYSIYMVHSMVIGRGADVLRWLGQGALVLEGNLPVRRIVAQTPLLADLFGVILLALSVAVSWLTWRFIEDPARRWSRGIAARINRPLGTRRASH